MSSPIENNCNVTLRKHQMKAISLENINSSLSPLTSNDILGKSLDLSTNMLTSDMEDMKSEIAALKEMLSSTQNELDNVILENRDLGKQIASMNQELCVLKQLCRSPITSIRQTSRSTSAKKSARRRLTDSFKNTPKSTPDETNTKCPEPKNTITKDTSSQTTPNTKNTVEITEPNIENTNLTTDTQRKIQILGSQQCSGLAAKMIELRSDTKYEKYVISSFTKPQAPTEEILRNGYTLNLGNDDKLILLVGENDENPTKMLIELSGFLQKFTNTTVLVLSVIDNIYLNTNRLNHDIKIICNNFKNCKFIDINRNFEYRHNKKELISKNLNFVIDCIDYDKKFLSVKTYINNNNRKCTMRNKKESNKRFLQKSMLDYYPIVERRPMTNIAHFHANLQHSPHSMQSNNSFRSFR